MCVFNSIVPVKNVCLWLIVRLYCIIVEININVFLPLTDAIE